MRPLISSPNACFNTQPPEGGWFELSLLGKTREVSTHSRPKAAAAAQARLRGVFVVSTHSRPKAAGRSNTDGCAQAWFQHTAARRRLLFRQLLTGHSARFNTQPPEGGCLWVYGA